MIEYLISEMCQLVITISKSFEDLGLAWDLVQFLMLHVFAKYGRPIESDAWTLLRNKIEARESRI